MRISLKHTAIVLALGALAGGCASNQEEVRSAGPEAEEQTRVEVSNHHWSDVTVYAAGGGARVRLGTVVSMRDRTFEISPEMVAIDGSLQLVAEVIGSSRTHRSDRILVGPGDWVEWNLENHLALSNYSVRSDHRR